MMDKGIETFIEEIKQIIDDSRSKALRSVDFCRVQMYWAIGKRISEKEQQGKERADYGKYIIRNLSKEIEPLYGSGFGVRQLELSRQFYRTYPNANTLCSQLNWSQYKLLIAIPDPEKREYYQLEAVLSVARNERVPESPQEIIKDPMVLEFLGLERKSAYYEKDLESAVISHIADFLLEMGKGFSFVARQKRLLVEDDEYFADLVFYNRLLRSFVVIEIKNHKLTHQDLGQLQLYVNYYDRYEKQPDENPTIGILLCTEKNDTAVRLALPEDNKTILASKYQLFLPTEEQLRAEVEKQKQIFLQQHEEQNREME